MKQIIKTLASLKITLFGLFGYLLIVFFGTIAQVKLGIYYAQKEYFSSLFVWKTFGNINLPILPGGLLLGTILTINLIAAIIHNKLYRFKKLGLFFVHFGLIVLLAGGAITQFYSVESQLIIDEGATKNYSQDYRYSELVFIDQSGKDTDFIVAIPDSLLKDGAKLTHPDLPFNVKIQNYYKNAYVSMEKVSPEQKKVEGITKGMGKNMFLLPLPLVTQDDLVDTPVAIITLSTETANLGTWLISERFGQAQTVETPEKSYLIELRKRRYYTAYTLFLKDFRFDRYLGTEIPKNYSSAMHLLDPRTNEERDVLVYMNHPLRYEGKTYYQASFGQDEKTSVLQVVENPGWFFPYLSCTIISLGLLWHFFLSLKRFTERKVS